MSISDDDLADILGDSNGPAYRKTEERTGPPLEYVGEKLESALLACHDLLHLTQERDGQPQPAQGEVVTGPRGQADRLLATAMLAFHYALVSYLALYNMLHLANVPGLPERLAATGHTQFREWLSRVTAEGSVTDG